MNGFSWENGRIVIDYEGRRVASTGGTLLQFMATSQIFEASITFPDPAKGQIYNWCGSVQRAPGDNFFATRSGRSVVGARPQEWTGTVVLGTVPAGADLLMCQATFSRTVAPSHLWFGTAISPVIPLNVAIQMAGSMPVEAAIGITRSLTIDIIPGEDGEDGSLVALLEQSVGPAAGNFRAIGEVPVQTPDTSTNTNRSWENVGVGGAMLPVLARYEIDQGQAYSGVFGSAQAETFANSARYGFSAQAPYDDPTNYSSTYNLIVNANFGRRS